MIWVLIPFKDRALYEDFKTRKTVCEGASYLYIVNGDARSSEIQPLNKSEYLLETKDTGMYDAWNQGLDLVAGKADWIIFLGEDDELQQDYITQLGQLPVDHHIVYGDTLVVKQNAEQRIRYSASPRLFSGAKKIVQDLPYCGCAFAAHLFSEQGFRHDTDFKFAGDLDLLLSIQKKLGPDLRYLYLDVLQAKIGGYGVSRTNAGYQRYKIEWGMIRQKHDVIISPSFKSRIKELMFWLR